MCLIEFLSCLFACSYLRQSVLLLSRFPLVSPKIICTFFLELKASEPNTPFVLAQISMYKSVGIDFWLVSVMLHFQAA